MKRLLCFAFSYVQPIPSSASTFLTVAEELDDREHRKNNVIIYNLPETDSS